MLLEKIEIFHHKCSMGNFWCFVQNVQHKYTFGGSWKKNSSFNWLIMFQLDKLTNAMNVMNQVPLSEDVWHKTSCKWMWLLVEFFCCTYWIAPSWLLERGRHSFLQIHTMLTWVTIEFLNYGLALVGNKISE